MLEIPVLIVGGGPVGLTASLLLSQHGVQSLLVERHPGTAILPKARGINARTMEMYRQMGIEADIRTAGFPPEYGGMIVWTESLAGKEINRIEPGRNSARNRGVSPATNCGCAQDDFEPVVRRHAEEAGPGALRFDTELTDISCDADGATGTLTVRSTVELIPFRARYVIGADGAQSRMRKIVDAQMIGERDVYDSLNIHCRVDLTQWVRDRPAALYFVEQPDLRGTFLTINGTDRWGFLIHSLKHYNYTPDHFTPERCIEIIRKAVGMADLKVEILGVSAWTASAVVADRYRNGPVFLAGDAAHEMPPTGGFGLNTGVQDVHNLAWKLAAVLHGNADESLLDSYDAERRPQAERITQASLLNALSMGRTARQSEAKLPRREFLNEQGLIFGARYVSSAVIADSAPPPEITDSVTEYIPSAYPGCRAPHVWLHRGGERLSTVDLFGGRFVLLAGTQRLAWRDAAATSKLPIDVHIIGEDVLDNDNEWRTAYGLDEGGAVLVRPDGYVAWRTRSQPDDPKRALAAALDLVLGRAVTASVMSH
jgi:putative polyketide hydroxylase